jgi:hypothetical protein
MWWLARTPHGSRFLLIYTCGVAGAHDDVLPLHPAHAVADDIIQFGHTLHTFASGFHCMVFSKDTSQLHPPRRLRKMHDLRPYSLFLGVNYVINIAVAGEDVAPGYLTRRRCVYTLHQAIGYDFRPRPEVCRFSLNGIDATIDFSTNSSWAWSETPIWFIPSFANALDWNYFTPSNAIRGSML